MRKQPCAAALTTLLGALALVACDGDAGNAPGAVSEGEAQALEEAAAMLDERQLPEGTLPPDGLSQDSSADTGAAEAGVPASPQEAQTQ
jgi:hypothetical protein